MAASSGFPVGDCIVVMGICMLFLFATHQRSRHGEVRVGLDTARLCRGRACFGLKRSSRIDLPARRLWSPRVQKYRVSFARQDEEEALQPTDPGFHSYKAHAFRNLSSRGVKVDAVEEGIRNMIAHSAHLEDKEFGFLVKTAGLSGLYDLSREVLDSATQNGKANTITYNTAISACRANKDLSGAMSIFEDMLQRGIEPNAITYVVLLNVCGMTNSADHAVRLLDDMEQRGIKRDGGVCKSATMAFSRIGDWRRAVQFLTEMEDSGVLPDEHTYDAVISACIKHGKKEGIRMALELLDGYEAAGLRWGSTTYANAIMALARSGKAGDAIEMFRTMPVKKTYPVYNAVLRAYDALPSSRRGVWQDALRVFEAMHAKDVKRGPVNYNIVLNVLGEAKQWQRALRVFNEMPEEGTKPNSYNYVTVISAVAKSGQWEKTLELLNRMETQGVESSLWAFNAHLRALSRAAANPNNNSTVWEQGLRVVDMLEERGLMPTPITYVELIRLFSADKKWEMALEFLDLYESDTDAIEAGKTIADSQNLLTQAYGAAIDSCFKNGLWERALQLASRMSKKGVEQNQYYRELMLRGLASSRQWAQAVEKFEEMKKTVKPTEAMFVSVVSALEKAGKKKMATKYYEMSLHELGLK
mmetsp:Transcript_4838/g.9473  ORF Transcript_4838/g.9473 Transcript_4838/m.9473 type:complete len:643 (-) Transcript_4838:229-2157(-)|eukprot:CAMPEP_0167775466 /NCGR_PEP_ID=MMETSP0111_2-20121227/2580_1 /TAXON_ID=91324 /ORGANISM="Lotharella globosa, Strain CCCM811" /LENGTH=642 /DNA_ID=CAMNT_0007665395 /DNA_START=44 /DNA_END=1972 /DNA_ORIENTATION=+